MRKYPSDVSLSINCIDVYLEMVGKTGPRQLSCFPPQEWCAWTIPEIALKIKKKHCVYEKTCVWTLIIKKPPLYPNFCLPFSFSFSSFPLFFSNLPHIFCNQPFRAGLNSIDLTALYRKG